MYVYMYDMYEHVFISHEGRSAEVDRRLYQEVGGTTEDKGEGPAQDLTEKSCL